MRVNSIIAPPFQGITIFIGTEWDIGHHQQQVRRTHKLFRTS